MSSNTSDRRRIASSLILALMFLFADLALPQAVPDWSEDHLEDSPIISQTTYSSSATKDTALDSTLRTSNVFLIDKERNQRGRFDDRDKSELKKNTPTYGLSSYNCLDVSVLKNKMSEDVRILFTEYRQKRKGNFNSTSRRADDLRGNEKN